MRNTRYRFLVLLSSLLMLTGCSRRDILDDYPVSGVDIKLDWDVELAGNGLNYPLQRVFNIGVNVSF